MAGTSLQRPSVVLEVARHVLAMNVTAPQGVWFVSVIVCFMRAQIGGLVLG